VSDNSSAFWLKHTHRAGLKDGLYGGQVQSIALSALSGAAGLVLRAPNVATSGETDDVMKPL